MLIKNILLKLISSLIISLKVFIYIINIYIIQNYHFFNLLQIMTEPKTSDTDAKIDEKSESIERILSPVCSRQDRSVKISKKKVDKSQASKKNRRTSYVISQKNQDQSITNINSKALASNKQKKITDYFIESNRLSNKLKKVYEPKEQVINQWELKYKEKQKEILEKDKQIQNLKKLRESISTKFGQQNMLFQNYKKKSREVLIKNLRAIYTQKRKQKQRPNRDLGFMKQTTFVEGRLIIQNKQKIQTIMKKIAELQQQFKKLKNNKSDQYYEEKEALQFRIDVLNKDQKQLLQEQKKLHIQKQLYLARNRIFNQEIASRFNKEDWPLINNRYQSLELLGKGGFSQVYRCYDLHENTEVALKLSFYNSDNADSVHQYMKHISRQYKTQKTLNHKNIVRLIQVIQLQRNTIATILQLCSGPDLSSYIKKYQCLEEKEAKFIIKQILSALNYMDSRTQKIIHYDLKPQNIMFHQGIIKIVDFGLCKIVETNQTRIQLTSQGTGTYWYLPPQTFELNQIPRISNKVDIWSVGVIFYEMIFGRRPFGHGMSQNKIINEGIITRAYNVEFNTPPIKKYKVSDQAKQFIRGCLQYSQQKRLSVAEACNHSYIKK